MSAQISRKLLAASTYTEMGSTQMGSRESRVSVLHSEQLDPHPVFLIRGEQQISEINHAAKIAYSLQQDVCSLQELPFDRATLQWIDACCVARSPISALQVRRTDSGRSVSLIVHSWLGLGIVLRTSELGWSPELTQLVQATFSLTSAEIAVTRLLIDGYSITEAAGFRNTAIVTVRTQVRSILQKTQCHSVSELNRLIFSIASLPELIASQELSAPETQLRPAEGRRVGAYG